MAATGGTTVVSSALLPPHPPPRSPAQPLGDGGILVAGTVQSGGRRRGTIWRKPYGGRWQTEALAGNGHVVTGVATDSGVALAVGGTLGSSGYSPTVWRLAGGEWVVQSPSISTSGRTLYNSYGESFESLSGDGGEWWATAYIDAVYVLLRSSDGTSWNEVILPFGLSDPAGPAVNLLASAGSRALVASSDPTQPVLVAAEGQTSSEVISEALPKRSSTRYASTADVAQGQLVVVGGQEDADPAPVSLGGLVWVSNDGRHTRLTSDAQFDDADPQRRRPPQGASGRCRLRRIHHALHSCRPGQPDHLVALGHRTLVRAAADGANGIPEHDEDARCGRGEPGGGRRSRGHGWR